MCTLPLWFEFFFTPQIWIKCVQMSNNCGTRNEQLLTSSPNIQFSNFRWISWKLEGIKYWGQMFLRLSTESCVNEHYSSVISKCHTHAWWRKVDGGASRLNFIQYSVVFGCGEYPECWTMDWRTVLQQLSDDA